MTYDVRFALDDTDFKFICNLSFDKVPLQSQIAIAITITM